MGIYKSTRHFVVHREPFGKVRAHPYVIGKHARMHNDDRNGTYEGIVRSEYLAQVGDVPPFTGPVGVEICAFFPIAKSNINTKAKRKDWEDGKLLPTIKPDLDNVVKSICDALNGLAWIDDKQVVCLNVAKCYVKPGMAPQSHVNITPVSGTPEE